MNADTPAEQPTQDATDLIPYAGKMTPPPRPKSDGKIDAWFAYLVGILLLVIIAALTMLTFRYRTAASRAQADFRRANNALSLIHAMPPAMAPALTRADYTAVTEEVTVNGREVEALGMEPGLAVLIGLAPGDVVVVRSSAAPSQPSTSPDDGSP